MFYLLNKIQNKERKVKNKETKLKTKPNHKQAQKHWYTLRPVDNWRVLSTGKVKTNKLKLLVKGCRKSDEGDVDRIS